LSKPESYIGCSALNEEEEEEEGGGEREGGREKKKKCSGELLSAVS